jgi:uncharacterized protein involved in exopolysaccharide biosynthesis
MAEQANLSANPVPEVSEISLETIFQFIRKYIILFLLSGLAFGILGYALSFLFPISYIASTVLLPESATSASGMGSLSGLARLSGLTKNEGGGAIQPDLYPAILETIPFGLHLLEQPVVDENNRSYNSVEDFLNRDNDKISDPKSQTNVKHKISTEILSLTKDEDISTRKALTLVTSAYDIKSGVVTITSETSDPVVTAQIVEIASKYLIQYVTEYRTQRAVREVEFLEQRVKEAKARQQNSEFSLQSYRDRNRNSFLNVARIEEQRLQADFLLAQSLYSDIVRKYEEARIKVKEEQPVIKVLEPASVPLKRSKPKRLIIALIFSTIGSLATFLYVILTQKSTKTTSTLAHRELEI